MDDFYWESVFETMNNNSFNNALARLAKNVDFEKAISVYIDPDTKKISVHGSDESTEINKSTVLINNAPNNLGFLMLVHNHYNGDLRPSPPQYIILNYYAKGDLHCDQKFFKNNLCKQIKWSPIEIIVASNKEDSQQALVYQFLKRPKHFEKHFEKFFGDYSSYDKLDGRNANSVADYLNNTGLYSAAIITVKDGVFQEDLGKLQLVHR